MITIVSGLPRSGTSLMMQMLHRGGMPVLQDQRRLPDASNPRGYFEYELVKRIESDASWFEEAEGKAVKIVVPLIRYIPPAFRYNVLFLERPVDEILRSQTAMLRRNGRDVTHNEPSEWKGIFEKERRRTREWLSVQPNIRVLDVRYRSLIENGEHQARVIRGFLGIELDISSMCSAIDPGLFHEKSDDTEIIS